MSFLKTLAEIPIDRLTRYVVLALAIAVAMEHMPWWQGVIEHGSRRGVRGLEGRGVARGRWRGWPVAAMTSAGIVPSTVA